MVYLILIYCIYFYFCFFFDRIGIIQDIQFRCLDVVEIIVGSVIIDVVRVFILFFMEEVFGVDFEYSCVVVRLLVLGINF